MKKLLTIIFMIVLLSFNTLAETGDVEVLVIGGGGGSGGAISGGAGAGGYVYNSAFTIEDTQYSVVVGDGGSGTSTTGINGEDSTFHTITAVGGGGSGYYFGGCTAGSNGGSGGGGGVKDGSLGCLGGTGSQGGDGGRGNQGGGTWASGGGGGASANGQDATKTVSGNGGDGIANSISGSSVYYAGGGGAGSYLGTAGNGGLGGGGDGSSSGSGDAGTDGLGGGAGGSTNAFTGSDGGSGVVIISYPTSSATATGGTITTSGGNTIHTFTSDGTFNLTGFINEEVTNYAPSNNDHDNNDTIYFNANTSSLDGVSCELFLNTVSYGNATSSTTNVIKDVNSLSDDVYTWYFQCGDTLSTSNSTFVYDTINPLYNENALNGNTSNFDKPFNTDYIQTFSGNMSDSYLFAWNYTIYDDEYNIMFTNETTNLTSSFEEINHYVNLKSFAKGTYTQNVTVSDDHTAKWIPDNWGITQNNNEVTFNTDTNTITLQSEIANLQGFESTYLTDRYSFSFSANNQRSEWGFNLFCDETLYYRGDLYDFPVFVCGDNWVDFNVINNGVQEVVVKPLSNGGYNINIKTTQSSDKIEFNSIGGLNIISYVNTFEVNHLPTIELNDYKAYNSSGGYIEEFNTTNIPFIETTELSYIINGHGSELNSWYLNFTANGTGSCATGNLQTDECYSYMNTTNQWIQYINGSISSNFNGILGNQGDAVVSNLQAINNSYWLLNITLDEHYNPNIFKPIYSVNPNWSDVKFQDDVNTRITGNNLVKVEYESNTLFLTADVYKLDFRVNYSTQVPTQPLDAYFCNSTYTTGLPEISSSCVLIASKSPSELSDDGTKFRSIYTSDAFVDIGLPNQLILQTDENSPNKYYSIKTVKRQNLSKDVYTSYSGNNGLTWNLATDDYESEANTNWFFDGLTPTQFVSALSVSTSTNQSSIENFSTWSIDANQRYAPLISITDPRDNDTIFLYENPYNITWSVTDFNNDDLTLSLYVNGILVNNTLTQDDNSQLYNFTLGVNNVTIYAVKDLYPTFIGEDTHIITVSDIPLPPLPTTIYGVCENVTLGSNSSTPLKLNMSLTTDPNGDNFTHDLYLLMGIIDYSIVDDLGQYTQIYDFNLNSTGLIHGTYNFKVITTDDTNLSNESISSCEFDICISNWVATKTTCLNDTQLITYNDANSCIDIYDVPVDNGTFISCEDNILSDQEFQEYKTMLVLLFIAFVVLIFVQVLNFNKMVTLVAMLSNILISIGMFTIINSNYIVLPIVMILMQIVIAFMMIRYNRD